MKRYLILELLVVILPHYQRYYQERPPSSDEGEIGLREWQEKQGVLGSYLLARIRHFLLHRGTYSLENFGPVEEAVPLLELGDHGGRVLTGLVVEEVVTEDVEGVGADEEVVAGHCLVQVYLFEGVLTQPLPELLVDINVTASMFTVQHDV